MIGEALGPYTIRALLGSGGTGHVYAAFDHRRSRMVAIKILRPEFGDDPELLQRFRQEADSLARLAHRNITEFYALEQAVLRGRQCLFMVMELIEGITLEQVVAQAGRLGAEAGLAVIAQAIAGLSYAHGLGTVHRDIKPSNLMLNESGVLKIMDFGIARVEGSERLTRQGMIIGTLAYIAPEQIKGEAGDARSDIYSLGCVFYELLAGTQPFQGSNDYELIRAQIDQTPRALSDLVPELPAQIGSAVMRALAKLPEERFQSLDDFAEQLGAATIGDAPAICTQLLPASRRASPPVETDATVHGAPLAAPPPAKPVPAAAAQRRPRSAKWRIGPLDAAAVLAAILSVGYLIEQSHLASADRTLQTASPPRETPAATPPAVVATPPAIDIPPAAVQPDPSPDAAPEPAEHADNAVPEAVAGDVSAYAGDGWPVIEGHVIRLSGLDLLPAEAAKPAAEWIKAHGNFLDCRLAGGAAYRCLTRQNLDLAQAILLNGGARASADAPVAYRDAEAQARKGKRGLWR
jgi:serine/threonine-protein kinase